MIVPEGNNLKLSAGTLLCVGPSRLLLGSVSSGLQRFRHGMLGELRAADVQLSGFSSGLGVGFALVADSMD